MKIKHTPQSKKRETEKALIRSTAWQIGKDRGYSNAAFALPEAVTIIKARRSIVEQENRMDDLWEALMMSGQDKYFQQPYLAFEDPIYGISTRPGFIFDDIFWDVFHSFSFHICHVTALVNENGTSRVFDLRFKPAPNNTGG